VVLIVVAGVVLEGIQGMVETLVVQLPAGILMLVPVGVGVAALKPIVFM